MYRSASQTCLCQDVCFQNRVIGIHGVLHIQSQLHHLSKYWLIKTSRYLMILHIVQMFALVRFWLFFFCVVQVADVQ